MSRPSGCCAASCRAGWARAWPGTGRWTAALGPPDPQAYAGLLCRVHPVGTAEDCGESMVATVETTGIRHLLCVVEGCGDPARTAESIARLGAGVLPVLRRCFGCRIRSGRRPPLRGPA